MGQPFLEGIMETGGDELCSLKGGFPFRLGTTSFILPDHITPNVRFLGPLVDEIELLCFDGGDPEHRPSRGNVAQWASLKTEHTLDYNVHLPIDSSLGDPDITVRRRSCRAILDIYDRTRRLDPTVYILHLDRATPTDGWSVCRDRWRWALDTLLAGGVEPPLLALENLDYPIAWIDDLAAAYGLSLCLDMGHLVVQQGDLAEAWRCYGNRTTMIHLHGVVDGRDHRSLAALPAAVWSAIGSILTSYRRGVCIEVFSLCDLATSLARMEELRPWPR